MGQVFENNRQKADRSDDNDRNRHGALLRSVDTPEK